MAKKSAPVKENSIKIISVEDLCVFTGRRDLQHIITDTSLYLDFLHGTPTRISAPLSADGKPANIQDTTVIAIDHDVSVSDGLVHARMYKLDVQKGRVIDWQECPLVFKKENDGIYLENESLNLIGGLIRRPYFVQDLTRAVGKRLMLALQTGTLPEPAAQKLSTDFWTENALFVTRHKEKPAPEKTAEIKWPEDPDPVGWGVMF